MSELKSSLVFVVAFFLLGSGMTQAQEPGRSPFSFSIDGGGVHQSETDLKDGVGSFAVDRWFVSTGVNYSWDAKKSIGFSVGGGKSSYDFDPESGFGGGEPWNKVLDFRASLNARFSLSETATAIIIPTIRFNGESGADTGDSRTFGLFAAAMWRINEDLTLGPGLGVFSRLEDGSRIFPILAIDWDISERWNLGTGRGLAASQGPGLTLGYKASEHWTIALSGRVENLEFRLDEHGPAPEGVGRDQSFPLVISGVLEPNGKSRLSLFAGAEFSGKLKLKNSLGETISESSYDPALIIGASFYVRF